MYYLIIADNVDSEKVFLKYPIKEDYFLLYLKHLESNPVLKKLHRALYEMENSYLLKEDIKVALNRFENNTLSVIKYFEKIHNLFIDCLNIAFENKLFIYITND